MLDSVLKFFQEELTAHLKLIGLKEFNVQFPVMEDRSRESIDFTWEALNLLLVNLEEETSMRQGDIFQREKNGSTFPAFPEIRLNLYLLFVANRSNYLTSMHHLSMVLRYFQANRVFDRDNTPALPKDIEKLTMELITLPFAQQNEVWNALRTSYKPSLLYKVRMVVFSQDEPLQHLPGVEEMTITTSE